MARYIAVIRFSDGLVLYGLYDGATESVTRALFDDADMVQDMLDVGYEPAAPSEWPSDDEECSVHPFALYGDDGTRFDSMASRTRRWLTGSIRAMTPLHEE